MRRGWRLVRAGTSRLLWGETFGGMGRGASEVVTRETQYVWFPQDRQRR